MIHAAGVLAGLFEAATRAVCLPWTCLGLAVALALAGSPCSWLMQGHPRARAGPLSWGRQLFGQLLWWWTPALLL